MSLLRDGHFSRGRLDATAVWGRNLEVTPLDSVLLEANLDLDGSNAPFYPYGPQSPAVTSSSIQRFTSDSVAGGSI